MCGWMTAQSRRAAVREIAINHGTFQRQNAAAMSSYFRLSENVVLSGGLSYGVEAKQSGYVQYGANTIGSISCMAAAGPPRPAPPAAGPPGNPPAKK